MMGYLLLLAATFLNIAKSYSTKRISGRVESFSETVDVSLFRNLLCALIGAVLVAAGGFESFCMPPLGWLICTVSGIAVGINYIVWVLALKSGVYMFASAVNSASFILAALCGILFFGERLTLPKGIAILLILLAILFMGKYQSQARGKVAPMHALYLLLVFVTAGGTSATQKWFTLSLPHVSVHTFSFYSLLISVPILAAMTFFIPNRPPIKKRLGTAKALFPWIAVMAVCLYAVTYLQTAASALLEAIVMYPLYNGSLLVAGSLMAWLCFSEKPNRNSIIGVILVFSAVVLFGLS